MADPLDLLDEDEAKAAISTSASRVGPDSIPMWVTAVSRRIDARCGPVVIREVADEVHPGGGWFLIPRLQPVSAITAAVEYNSTVPTTLAAEVFPGTTSSYDYWLDHIGVLRRRSGGSDSVFGGTRVVLTYDAGRYESTTAVDAKFKLAAGSALRRLWAREAGAWSRADPFGGEDQGSPGFFKVIDPVIDEWLSDELLEPVMA